MKALRKAGVKREVEGKKNEVSSTINRRIGREIDLKLVQGS